VDPYIGTAVLTRYSSGSDVILVELNGTQATISTGPLGTDAVAFRNVRQRNGWLLYQASGVWTLVALDGEVMPITPRTQYVDYAVPVSMPDGTVILLERANGRLTLRYPNTTLGWLVMEDLRNDGLVVPDAIELGGLVRVAWSNDQSESAAAFARADITLDDATRIDLNEEPDPPDPPDPEEPDMANAYVLLKKPDTAKDPLVTVTRVEEVTHDGKLFLKKPDEGGHMVCVNPDLGIEDRPPNTFGAWEEFVKTTKGDYAAVRGTKTGVIVAV
jgi:hypothetical protein